MLLLPAAPKEDVQAVGTAVIQLVEVKTLWAGQSSSSIGNEVMPVDGSA